MDRPDLRALSDDELVALSNEVDAQVVALRAYLKDVNDERRLRASEARIAAKLADLSPEERDLLVRLNQTLGPASGSGAAGVSA